MKFNISKMVPGVSVLALLMAGSAQAQDATGDGVNEEIIVTGTQIRGVQATGSQTLSLDAEAIQEEGALSTNELLSALPQIGQFNGNFEGDARGATQGISINRPNLRSLPGFNAASGSVTLILMDGHRLAPVGVNESAIDPDIVPAAVLQRVEVVTDGGSSIYGADAVGGVINFITRREFDGLQVDANYGVGDSIDGFQQWDATLTAGTTWQSGGAYISVGTSQREDITNGDTTWSRLGNWEIDGSLTAVDSECRVPAGTEERWFWYGAGWTNNPLAPGAGVFAVGSPCDHFAEQTLLPEQQRDNLFASLSQEVTDTIDLRVTGYYTQRTTTFSAYPLGYTTAAVSTPPAAPGTVFGEIAAVPFGTGFSFEPNAAYVDRNHEIEMETWGISPELTIDVGHDWEVRTGFSYGGSHNTQVQPGVNDIAAQDAVDNGDLDPLDVASADASVINTILDWEDARETDQEQINYRVIADGPVLQLPAGPLSVAVGFEYTDTSVEGRANSGARGSIDAEPFDEASRDVYSLFAEVSIPVIDALDLTLSGRYDEYSDFGSTTNPNFGFDLHPVDWFSVYGHWGTSFNAPTAIDQFASSVGRLTPNRTLTEITQYSDWTGGGNYDGSGDDVLQAIGEAGDLRPQTSEQWTLGVRGQPIDNLRFNLNYYEIDFSDILGALDASSQQGVQVAPEKILWNPTQAELDDFVALLDDANLYTGLVASDFAFLLDRRTSNLSSAKLTGVDFSVNYDHETDFGTFEIGVAGTQRISFTLNDVDQLGSENSDLSVQGSLGWRLEDLSTRVTVNYTGGFDTIVGQNGQTSVDGFTTTDLFVGYDLPEMGGNETSLRFLVDNVFDEEPPEWRRNSPSVSFSGFTLGRVFQVGVTTKF